MLEECNLGVGWVAAAWVEGVGSMGVARTLEVMGSWGGSSKKPGWHIWLSAQNIGIIVSVVDTGGTPVDIMMVSITFEM